VTTIIDYGTGNIGSIANMLKKIGEESVITAEREKIEQARRLILCGIGAFDDGISKLKALGIIDVLKKKVLQDNIPILGICLGMQLFTKGSEEGSKEGLGFVNAYTRRFNFSGLNSEKIFRIPHMGWNLAEAVKPSPLYNDMYPDSRFYFVHSYHVILENKEDELLQTSYGYSFTSAFQKDNIMGVQFHPEKSHKYGIRLYENFVRNY
jgi:glutamine amidotransferase